jgi:hypothetical protein
MTQAPDNNLITAIMALKTASLEELTAQYTELFGEKRHYSNNKTFLWRKIAYRLQEIEYGGLSDDTRLPIPEAIIRKEYKGKLLEVKVLEKGFEYDGKAYRTLSAVAKAITGDHWNGYLFFKP